MTRAVLVVVGAGGMGAALAHRMGAGRHILVADCSDEALKTVGSQLHDDGHLVSTKAVDITDRRSVAALADCAAEIGPVTAVAHTAGVSPAGASVSAIFAVDLVGTAHIVDEFARAIAPGGAGVVVASMAAAILGSGQSPDTEAQLAQSPPERLLEISAVRDLLGSDTTENRSLAYGLAKRGNQLRVQAAAARWGAAGARINSISPGVISTEMGRAEMTDGTTGAVVEAMVAGSPSQRVGTPGDVAAVAEFLFGSGSSFVTGTDVLVDGGVVAAMRYGIPTA
ncbi:SDR family oxidoreductase [Mycobacterium sp.]|uniref:SDR family oxidoreductase n=1 Tax=Mycobacterium sp. TaxID=1785 RepID=UPI002D918503|nr:SDR family oxidoreductase [Mycobacterium sp.]